MFVAPSWWARIPFEVEPRIAEPLVNLKGPRYETDHVSSPLTTTVANRRYSLDSEPRPAGYLYSSVSRGDVNLKACKVEAQSRCSLRLPVLVCQPWGSLQNIGHLQTHRLQSNKHILAPVVSIVEPITMKELS